MRRSAVRCRWPRRPDRLAAAGNNHVRPRRLRSAARHRTRGRRKRVDRRGDGIRPRRHGRTRRARDFSRPLARLRRRHAWSMPRNSRSDRLYTRCLPRQGGAWRRDGNGDGAAGLERRRAWLDKAREIIGEEGGASAWSVGGTGKLLARLYAGDGYSLRKRLVPLLGLLNGQAGTAQMLVTLRG